MAENITNELMYETMKAIRADVADLKADARDIKARMVTMERNPGNDRERHQ